MRIDKFMNYSG